MFPFQRQYFASGDTVKGLTPNLIQEFILRIEAQNMTSRGGAQRPNGATQGKICQFKLVLLGESAVGKSSLVLRFVKGQFHEYQESTIGGKWT